MKPNKIIEFNKYLEKCRKKTHLTFYDYQAVLALASMQFYNNEYDYWQSNHIEPESKYDYQHFDIYEPCTPINNLDDLIYNTNNIQCLQPIREELQTLNSMVGMKELKNSVVNQILYYIQNMHIGSEDYKHIVIYGPPGTGKTEIAKLLGNIFSKIAKKTAEPIFKKAVRADLIAGYVGQTAIKTKALIEKCLGGVLFIDEAYSFGDDTFSKECVDTLCESLSENRDNLTVIIAGYEDKLQSQFFALNPGLESRFTWRYSTSAYTNTELHDIFILKIKQQGWTAEPLINWFKDNKKSFPGYGRDMESLLFKVKVEHSRRVFCENSTKKHLTVADMDAGYAVFLKHTENKKNEIQKSMSLMYI